MPPCFRLPFLLACLALLVSPARAAAPLGSVAAVLPSAPSKLLADPARPRVYAADLATNSVVVIDTTTLKVIATVPVGSTPVDLAISPDGNTLYVANSASTLAAVGVLDLDTLTLRASYPLPGTAQAVAAGLDGRVYVLALSVNSQSVFGGNQSVIYQLDGATGAVQTTFDAQPNAGSFLQISPDRTRLFTLDLNNSYGSLDSFDVSTATPVALQKNDSASENAGQLVISQTGKYICVPSGGGNPGAGGYGTFLYSSTDVAAYYGAFSVGAYPGPLAFSPDDSLVYHTRSGLSLVLDVFNTATFAKGAEILLPYLTGGGAAARVPTIVADHTGSYVFVSESSDYYGTTGAGQLAVLTTGAGTLTPPSLLPAITSSLSVTAAKGVSFSYQITASNTPTRFGATSLPNGLSVDPATGLISGTPTESNFSNGGQLSASNASGTATAAFTVEIDDTSGYRFPFITTTNLTGGVVGQPYSVQVLATNLPTSYSATGLPTGLSIDPHTGIISGTPTKAGGYDVELQGFNAYGNGGSSVFLTTLPSAPAITSSTAASGVLGVAFTYQTTASNQPTGFVASGLPAGLSIEANTGLISGTPTEAGTFTVALIATNATGVGSTTLTLTVSAVAMPVPVITGLLTASAQQGAAFSYQIAATNTPTSFSATGLPEGLTLDPLNGLISGTPTQSGVANIGLGASNGNGTGIATLSLNVAASLPEVTLVATVPLVTSGTGQDGEIVVSLSTVQTSDVVVSFTVKGTAVNGADYVLLKATKKIKAGKTSKTIRVVPQGDMTGLGRKTVVLTLLPSNGYTIGPAQKAKAKIFGHL